MIFSEYGEQYCQFIVTILWRKMQRLMIKSPTLRTPDELWLFFFPRAAKVQFNQFIFLISLTVVHPLTYDVLNAIRKHSIAVL